MKAPFSARKIKILHVITGLNTGGAEMMLLKLVSNIDPQNFQNVIVTLMDGGDLLQDFEAKGVKVQSLGMEKGSVRFASIFRLMKIMRAEKPDVVQTWLYHADLIGLIAAKLTGKKRLAWNLRRSDVNWSEGSLLSKGVLKLLAKLSSWPDAVFANSKTGIASHKRIGYKPKLWVYVPNGFDMNKFVRQPGARKKLLDELRLPEDVFLIGLVARLDPIKDHQGFLKAAKLLRDRFPQAHFVLAGRGLTPENAELADWIGDLQLSDCVHLLGNRTDVHHLMSAFDIASLVSLSEGFPNVVGEAMACETPCVVTDVGDSAHIVGDTGYVVPPANPAETARAWAELLGMPHESRTELGKSARRRIEDNFSLKTVVLRYEALYRDLHEMTTSLK